MGKQQQSPIRTIVDGIKATLWLWIGIFWILALVLGVVGFTRYNAQYAIPSTPLNNIYLALQLIPMNSGGLSSPAPWQLEIARFLIPALTALTAVKALTLFFRDQAQAFQLKSISKHIIICGLSHKGYLLTQRFLEAQAQIVVIERDEDNDWVEICRQQGVIVLTADARQPLTLQKAGIQRARALIAVCDDDAVNAEIMQHARQLSQNRPGEALTCLVHLVDPRLYELLKVNELSAHTDESFRLEYFNIFERGARLLLSDFPPFHGKSHTLLVVGVGWMGENVVIQATRLWRETHPNGNEKLHLRLVDRNAKAITSKLFFRYPPLSRYCSIEPIEIDVHSPEFEKADFLFESSLTSPSSANPPPTSVGMIYICLDNDTLGLHTALSLQNRIRGKAVPVIVRMTEKGGLSTLINQAASSDRPLHAEGIFGNLHSFSLLDRTCTTDLLLGTHEILARALHESYLAQQEKAGVRPVDNPQMIPWEHLPEPYKESNRRQVDHFLQKLEGVDCWIVKDTNWDEPLLQFTDSEIEQMAMMEHKRWCSEKFNQGFTYAPGEKTPRTHPDLVEWEKLSEDSKKKNRSFVRDIPVFLQRENLRVERAKKERLG